MKIPVTIIGVIVGLFVLAHTWDAFKPGRYFGEFSFLKLICGKDGDSNSDNSSKS